MPIILDNGSDDIRTWLDPNKYGWSKELQAILKPYDGELEVYPVAKEVGKVGNNSPNFIIPVASSENKSNIAYFFSKGGAAKGKTQSKATTTNSIKEEEFVKQEPGETCVTLDHNSTEDNAPLVVPKDEVKKGFKRELEDSKSEEPPSKTTKLSSSPSKAPSPAKPAAKAKSAITNIKPSPKKPASKEKGTQKITSFFNK